MKLKLKCLTFNIFNIVCIAASVIECSIWNHIKRKQLFVSLSSEQEALSDGDMNAVATKESLLLSSSPLIGDVWLTSFSKSSDIEKLLSLSEKSV